MIYCLGDSITKGMPGTTFVKFISPQSRRINCGLGGDTLIGISARIRKMAHKIGPEDYVILGIGTNDLLIPHFLTCSASWVSVARGLIKRGSIPSKDKEEFSEKYRELLKYLHSITGNVIVFGLPLIETTELPLDALCGQYNKEIERICREEKVPYVDFRAWQIEQKKLLMNDGSFFTTSNHRTAMDMILDGLRTTYLPFERSVCRKRGLAMTVDGVHINSDSAKGLAGLINRYLQ
jgi:lysophospholipase L1-like esterase